MTQVYIVSCLKSVLNRMAKKLIRVDITTYDKNMTARNASFLLEGTLQKAADKVLSPDYSLPEISMGTERWNSLPFRAISYRKEKPGHGQEPLCLIWN